MFGTIITWEPYVIIRDSQANYAGNKYYMETMHCYMGTIILPGTVIIWEPLLHEKRDYMETIITIFF